jgi:6-phosphofructokinase 1
MKKIGVLTSGGDSPGMNAAIRAVVRGGIYYGLKVFGIKKGYNGLIEGDIEEMDFRSVSEIIQRGGTILKTARCLEFKTEEGIKKALTVINVFGLDGIVVIGGDGSYKGARDLSRLGVPIIGIPGTIDNDISSTEYTIGFDTALNTVKDAIDKIKDTTSSHDRCSVIEVMGKNAGYIALEAGIANGAEIMLLPEQKLDFDKDVLKRIIEGKNVGRKHNIIIVAEGVGGTAELAARIQKETGIETRVTILGHIQRGGSPTVRDRVIASRMGIRAVELLKDGISNRVIGLKDTKIVDYDVEEALNMEKTIDSEIASLVKILS